MRKHVALASIAFLFGSTSYAESLNFDFSKKIDNYYQFNVSASKTFTVTKVTAALTAWSKPMTLAIRCDGKELAAQRKTFTNPQLNVSQTFNVTAEVNANTCANKAVEIYFETPGLATTESQIAPEISTGRLLDEDFVRLVNDQLEVYTDDLVSYSGTMSQQAASQNTLYCIIQNYERRPNLDGIIRELKTNYFNTFGVLYDAEILSCPSLDTLEVRIDECVAKKTLRTPFCNTTKLYLASKEWLMDSYAEAKIRAAKLSNDAQATIDELNKVKESIKAEVQESDSTLGTETEFEE